MKCHVLSCDVMFRRVAPLSVRLAEAPPSVASCISFLNTSSESTIRVHSFNTAVHPPPACLRRVPVHVSPRRAPFRPPRRSSAVRILHTVPLSAFRSPAAGLPAARPCFARIACAPARVCAGAVRAPDCPRLCARARRRAHVSRPFLWGFFAPVRGRRKRPPDAASSCPILPRFYRDQALTENYFIVREQSSASGRRHPGVS